MSDYGDEARSGALAAETPSGVNCFIHGYRPYAR